MIAKRLPLIVLLAGLALAMTINRIEVAPPATAAGESRASGHPG